jgi:hypothetical protein
VSTWLLLIVMSLATYRLTRLVVKDTLPPVLWLRDRLAGGWRPITATERDHLHEDKLGKVTDIKGVINRYITRVKWSPDWLAELITCPWCASGWVAGLVTATADITIGIPAPVLSGLAVWAVGALLASRDWA